MVDGKRITNLLLTLFFIVMALPMIAKAEPQADYQLRSGDVIRLNLWTWGNEPLQQLETTVRPDGKVAVAVAMNQTEIYRLGPGDGLVISVWGYRDLENSEKNPIIIRPDGRFAFPLIGEVAAAGLTPQELTENLTARLGEYLKEPKVAVNVAKFRTTPLVGEFAATGLTLAQLTANISQSLRATMREARLTMEIVKYGVTRIYVLGEVNKPGMCEIERDHNLLDAVGAAGGFTKGANRKRVYLVRKGQSDKYTEINLDRMLKKSDLRQNYILNDGDVVYFARNGVNFVEDILPFITSIYYIRHM
ncbi:MAG: polysaccharide biosynthesis/export family protein [Bacillota bacterium]|jgi:polysaccharide export outer membrane protein